MSKLLILAAMAPVSVACANRVEDDMGAAPDQGDTTAVTHVIDSTRTSTPQDTLGPRDTDVQDTTAMQGDTLTSIHGNSAMTNHAVPDTTAAE